MLLSKNGSPPPFVKTLDLTSGSYMRGKVGLILVKIVFNCFNFYSIDREIRGKDGALDDRLVFSMAI